MMRENQIGLRKGFERFECLLDVGVGSGEKAVSESRDSDLIARSTRQEALRARAQLALSLGRATEHDPGDVNRPILGQKREQRSAAADIDVIAMRAEAENMSW